MIQNPVSAKSHRELLHALESARMRLSVAIAAETKSTPRERWLHYLDAFDQIRRFVRKLRNANSGSLPNLQGWIRALDTLEHLPVQNRVPRLCQILQDITAALE